MKNNSFLSNKRCIFLAEAISHNSISSYKYLFLLVKEATQIRKKVVLFLEGINIDYSKNLKSQLYNFHGGFNSQSFCEFLLNIHKHKMNVNNLVIKFPDIMIMDMYQELVTYNHDKMCEYQEKKDLIVWDNIYQYIKKNDKDTLYICYFGVSHSFNNIIYNGKNITRLGAYFESYFKKDLVRILLCLSTNAFLDLTLIDINSPLSYEVSNVKIKDINYIAIKMNTFLNDYPLWINYMNPQIKLHTSYPKLRSFYMSSGFLSEYKVCKIMFKVFKELKKTKKCTRKQYLKYFSLQYLFKITKPNSDFSNIIKILKDAILINGIGDIFGYYLIELSIYYLLLGNNFPKGRLILPENKIKRIKKYGIHSSYKDSLLLKSTIEDYVIPLNKLSAYYKIVNDMRDFFITNSPLIWKTDYPEMYKR